MSKQTAMQMAIEHYENLSAQGSNQAYVIAKFLKEKFLPLEKQQIIDAYHINPQEAKWKNIGINYYNETYGSNHIVDTNEMIDHIGDANKMVEISDEEIGKGCDENIPLDEADMWSERLYFRIGAKWYREQLKGGNK